MIFSFNPGKLSSKNRGFALILTLLALSLLSVIGFGMIALTTVQSKTMTERMSRAKAYSYARAGIGQAKATLKGNYEWTGGTTIVKADQQGEMEEGYVVTVVPDPNNANTPYKTWQVKSTGYFNGSKRTLEAWFDMETFALWALFFDDGENTGFTNADKMNGKVHTNRRMKLYGCPRFADRSTSSNIQHNSSGSVTWKDGSYDVANNRYKMASGRYTDDPSKYYWRYRTGDGNYGYDTYYIRDYDGNPAPENFAGAQPEIPLPTYNNPDLYGASTPKYFDYVESHCNGYVLEGNVYMKFDANGTVELTNSSGNLITKNKDGDPIVNPVSTQDLTIKVLGDIYLGYPRDGNPDIMTGRTTIIAARKPNGSGGYVKVKDSVVYKDKLQDILGIVAERDVQIKTGPYDVGDLEIDASVMALNGKVTVDSCTSGVRRGDLIIYGGVVAYQLAGTENASCTTGYGTKWSYDPKLYLKPPINWPLTGKVRPVSIRDLGALN